MTCHKQRSQWMRSECGTRVIWNLTLPLIPGIFSLLFLDLFDAYLISTTDTNSLTALGFTIPISNLMFGLSIGLSVAVVSSLTKAIGSQNWHQVKQIVLHSLALCLFLALAVGSLGYLTIEPMTKLLGLRLTEMGVHCFDCEEILALVDAYMSVRYLGLVFWLCPMLCIGIFRALGDTRLAAILLCSWSLSTAAIDAWLVLVKSQGLVGMAWGHLISDALFSVVCLYLLYTRGVLGGATWSWPCLNSMFRLAIPATLNNMLSPLAFAAMTAIVAMSGHKAVAALGIANRIEQLVLLLPMALTASLPVFVGQNWAAGLYERVHVYLCRCFRSIVLFQVAVSILLFISAGFIAQMLSEDPEVQKTLVAYLYIVPIGYGAMGVSIVITSVLNAIHEPLKALSVSILRLFVCTMPLLYIGHLFAGEQGVFVALAAANIVACFLSYQVMRSCYRDVTIIKYAH